MNKPYLVAKPSALQSDFSGYDAVMDEAWLAAHALEGEYWSAKPYAEAGVQVYKAPAAVAPWVVGFSPVGGTMWESGTIDGRSILLVLSEYANLAYLAYLRSIGVSYITIGREELRPTPGMPGNFKTMQGPAVDRIEALSVLYDEFAVRSLLLIAPGEEWNTPELSALLQPAQQAEEGGAFYF